MDTKRFLELYARGKTGEKVSKEDWDMEYIIENVMSLVEEYDFDWDENTIIPEDD
jgi:methylamine--corrinoid protein Co-methyltransferase